jgi:hypothetical protein
MPNVTLHLLLAERVLDGWSARPAGAPFPVEDPVFRAAFRQGAFAPDLGYFPGGERFWSDLAHCVGSGTLTRTLLARARTPLERAWTWGWVTHVVADRRIHPLVGQGVAEVVGDATGFVSADADPAAHVRVETGVDAWVSRVHPALRRRRFEPCFDPQSIGFVQRAFEEAYRIPVDPRSLLHSHRGTARMASHALTAVGLLSAAPERRRNALEESGVILAGFATRALGRGEMTVAFLSPLSPPAWLRIAVAEAVASFPGWVEAVRQDPDAGLPDVNLDTGAPDGSDPGHGVTRRTLALLAGLRGKDRPRGVPVVPVSMPVSAPTAPGPSPGPPLPRA